MEPFFKLNSSLTVQCWNMYPNSKFARFYNEHEGQSRKFFFDEDAEYFWIVLNFLRNGEVFPFDEEIFSVSAIWQKTSNSPNLSNSLRGSNDLKFFDKSPWIASGQVLLLRVRFWKSFVRLTDCIFKTGQKSYVLHRSIERPSFKNFECACQVPIRYSK